MSDTVVITEPALHTVVIDNDATVLVENEHVTIVTVGGSGGGATPAGATGDVQFNDDGALGADAEFHWDNTNKRLGIGTNAPDYAVHITPAYAPDPTGSLTIVETDVGGGAYPNQGLQHDYRMYTYRTNGAGYILSENYISGSYTDDGLDDTTYNLSITPTDALPSGADGFINAYGDFSVSLGVDNTVDNASVADAFSIVNDSVYIENNNVTVTAGDVTVGNGDLFVANGNVGIGTTTPTKKLDIYGDLDGLFDFRVRNISTGNFAQARVTFQSSGSSTCEIGMLGWGNTQLASAANAFFIWNENNAASIFGTNNLERMRITNAGTLQISGFGASTIGSVVKAASGQTANIHAWQNNSGTALASIGSAGRGTFAGVTSTVNGAASAPSVTTIGTWFSGGTATTTKPQVLIEPAGTTSTGWSTSGTGFGVNAPNGFAGRIMDLQLNGATRFNVTSAGVAVAASEVQSPTAFRLTAFGGYVGVLSGSRCTFGNGSGVSTFGTGTTSHVVSLIEAPAGQTADIEQWRVNSVAVASIAKNGAFKPASLADSAAENNTLYYSTTASKLVYKDAGGTVNALY